MHQQHYTLFQRRIVDDFCFSGQHLSKKFIALISVFISLSVILFDPVINSDGVLYLFAAETYLQSGFDATLKVYTWPFFSILIATGHQLTTLSLHASSQLIVTLCFMTMTYAFVRLCEDIGASKTAQLFALFVISFHPLMGDYRSSTMRDPGMWAFTLLALHQLIMFSRTPRIRHPLKWTVLIFLAFLFRIEAIFIALLCPLALLFIDGHPLGQRIKTCLLFYSMQLMLFCAALLVIAIASGWELLSFKLFDELQHSERFFAQFNQIVTAKADVIADGLLSRSAKDDAFYGVVSVYLIICVVNIFRAISPLYALILVWNILLKKHLVFCANANVIVKTYLAITISYLVVFTFSREFSLERYSFQVAIVVLLYLPFIFEKFWNMQSRPLLARTAIVLILLVYSLDTLVNSDFKKSYIQSAALWIQTEVGREQKIISNHHHIAYFNGRSTHNIDDLYLKKEEQMREWQPGVVYAFRAKEKDEDTLRERIRRHKAEILAEFVGEDDGVVIIFSLPQSRIPTGV